MYGSTSRIPTGVATEIIINPEQLALLMNGGGGSGGSGSGSGGSTDKPPAYYINGATDAIKRLLSKNMNKQQINAFLENYRQMIAVETNTTYVPTVVSSSITGVNASNQGGKITITTKGDDHVTTSEIVLQ